MKLAALYTPPGNHAAGWRMPGAKPGLCSDFQHLVHIVQLCEAAKMDAIFFSDNNQVQPVDFIERGDPSGGRYPRAVGMEAMTLLPALAAVTSRIGLIATATTTYSEPYTIARRFASIEQVSQGRSGWNLVTSQHETEAQNFGFEHHMEHDERYRRAEEFFDVVCALWDSWDDDAVIEDKANAMFFDVHRAHVLNHKGKYFDVRGPLNVLRSLQGRPVIAQAGSSGVGRELAARIADCVFLASNSAESAKAFSDDVRVRAAKYGRGPDELKMIAGIIPVLGRTEAEAREHYEELQSLITDDQALFAIRRLTGGVDLTKYPIDGPLPDLPIANGAQSRQQLMVDMARRESLSIRQIGKRFVESAGHCFFWGTPEAMADVMEDWFRKGACDGFNVMFPYYPRGVEDFVHMVIPELQRRGLFRIEYEGKTLRENLDLQIPESRYASSPRLSAEGSRR